MSRRSLRNNPVRAALGGVPSAFVFAAFTGAWAQPAAEYRSVRGFELMGDRIEEGELVAAVGQVFSLNRRVYFNENMMTAVPALEVDVANTPSDQVRHVHETCAGTTMVGGKYCGIVRGLVRSVGRKPRLFARSIEVKAGNKDPTCQG
jgi:hypothetical protein